MFETLFWSRLMFGNCTDSKKRFLDVSKNLWNSQTDSLRNPIWFLWNPSCFLWDPICILWNPFCLLWIPSESNLPSMESNLLAMDSIMSSMDSLMDSNLPFMESMKSQIRFSLSSFRKARGQAKDPTRKRKALEGSHNSPNSFLVGCDSFPP